MNAYIALGSNLNDPVTQLQLAQDHLSHIPQTRILRVSSVYRNPPWGDIPQPDFFNAIICIATDLSPYALLQHLKHIELAQGRTRTVRNGPRSIDLDLILFDDVHIHTDELTLPHPRYLDRNFVLIPLFEIAPDLMLPHGVRLADLIPSVNQDNLVKIENLYQCSFSFGTLIRPDGHLLPQGGEGRVLSDSNTDKGSVHPLPQGGEKKDEELSPHSCVLDKGVKDEGYIKVHILGAGAIGCLIAAQIYRAGIAVELLLKDEAALSMYQNLGGVTIIHNGKKELVLIPATTTDRCTEVHVVFVTTKAFDVAPALQRMHQALSKNSLVLLLNNGLGCYDELPPSEQRDILLGMHYCAAIRHAPFVIEAVNISTFYIGHPQNPIIPTHVQNLLAALAASGLHVQWEEQIMQKLWMKLGINCMINPLTTLLQCKNGVLLQQTELQQLMRALAEEIIAVAAAMHIQLQLPELLQFAHEVIVKTAQNHSSMLQDRLQQRRTELDYLNGYICQQAHHYRIAVPHNQTLTHLIHSLEYLYEKN